jgi:hypothetical protein
MTWELSELEYKETGKTIISWIVPQKHNWGPSNKLGGN